MTNPVLTIQLQLDIHSGHLELTSSFAPDQAEKRHRHLFALLREVRRLHPQSIVIHAFGLREVQAIAQLLITMLKSFMPRCQLEIIARDAAQA